MRSVFIRPRCWLALPAPAGTVLSGNGNLVAVGPEPGVAAASANRSNPLGVKSLGNLIKPDKENPYFFLTRNCQRHVTAVVNQLEWIQ